MARSVFTLLAFMATVMITTSASENVDQGTGTPPDLSSFNKAEQDNTADEEPQSKNACVCSDLSSVPNVPAQASDLQNLLYYITYPGAYVTYFPARNPHANPPIQRQATGVVAVFTLDILNEAKAGRLGSRAYGPIDKPPGYQDVINNGGQPTRGHLLAKSLGGSGVLVTNIVTMYEFANENQMEEWERRVANAYSSGIVSSGCSIYYEVHAQYVPGRLEPASISIVANVLNPYTRQFFAWFFVTIENSNLAPVTIHHWIQNLNVVC